jgi:hypothetical protein
MAKYYHLFISLWLLAQLKIARICQIGAIEDEAVSRKTSFAERIRDRVEMKLSRLAQVSTGLTRMKTDRAYLRSDVQAVLTKLHVHR